jgi:hypothetical protein
LCFLSRIFFEESLPPVKFLDAKFWQIKRASAVSAFDVIQNSLSPKTLTDSLSSVVLKFTFALSRNIWEG